MTKPVNVPIQGGDFIFSILAGGIPLKADALAGRSWENVTHDASLGSGISAWEIGLAGGVAPVGIVEGAAPAERHRCALEMADIASVHQLCHVSVLDLQAVISIPHAVVGLARKLAVPGFPHEDHRFPLASAVLRDMPPAKAVAHYPIRRLLLHPNLVALRELLQFGRRKQLLDRWVIVLLNADASCQDEGELSELLRVLGDVVFVLDCVPKFEVSRYMIKVAASELLGGSPADVDRDKALLSRQVKAWEARYLEIATKTKLLEAQNSALSREGERLTAERDALSNQLRLLLGKSII